MQNDETGKHLADVDPALFNETLQALLNEGVSPSGAPLTPDEAHIIAENLASARIRGKCECGEPNCNTYYFDVPDKPEGRVTYSVVRLYARGEHLLHIDSDGDLHKVQRLYEAGTEPRRLFTRLPDGSWNERVL